MTAKRILLCGLCYIPVNLFLTFVWGAFTELIPGERVYGIALGSLNTTFMLALLAWATKKW